MFGLVPFQLRFQKPLLRVVKAVATAIRTTAVISTRPAYSLCPVRLTLYFCHISSSDIPDQLQPNNPGSECNSGRLV
jgi:hypothetical protein